MSITSRCSTTVGSTIQNSRRRTRGAAIACLVDVMFTSSDVFAGPLAVHQAVVGSRGRGDVDRPRRRVVEGERAQRRPPVGRAGLRGDRFAHTVTVPTLTRLTSYSRRREAVPPGVRRGAVTGYGVMPAPVRPIRVLEPPSANGGGHRLAQPSWADEVRHRRRSSALPATAGPSPAGRWATTRATAASAVSVSPRRVPTPGREARKHHRQEAALGTRSTYGYRVQLLRCRAKWLLYGYSFRGVHYRAGHLDEVHDAG